MSEETRQKFLAAINERVIANGGTIEEIHFFQTMKQGILETGVAVVAASLAAMSPVDATVQEELPLVPHDRKVVYTARYRLTLKGPDRGKWEFTMHPEADAPLVTVDAVVRGVQRRSGDTEDPVRLTGEEVRNVLPQVDSPVTPV